MRSWSGSRSCSTNTSGRTSRHRFLNKAGETDGPRNVARVLGDSLSVFECRATRHLSIYQQRGLTEFRRQLSQCSSALPSGRPSSSQIC